MSRATEKAKLVYRTKAGSLYQGDAKELLEDRKIARHKGKVQLIFTSPPFPLNRKKSYGNLQGQEYVNWLADFASPLASYIKKRGSIVIELGNAWVPGSPTMSTLTMKALLEFQERANLHLCQEFICFNPARLPTPAQWVNVERARVKDAFTRVWWLSRTERPKADNRRVLTVYSDSMKQLLKRGTYNSGTRPSEANIGDTSFLKDNQGAIPPNVLIPSISDMLPELMDVLAIANTRSNDPYQKYCRNAGIRTHPARMPRKLIEFFVRFLTTEGDLVMDPFAGSNSTGEVSQALGRKWLGIEIDQTYAQASQSRFHSQKAGAQL